MLANLPVPRRPASPTWLGSAPGALISRKHRRGRRTACGCQRGLPTQCEDHRRRSKCTFDKAATHIFARRVCGQWRILNSAYRGIGSRNFDRRTARQTFSLVARIRFFSVHINYRFWPIGSVTSVQDHHLHPRGSRYSFDSDYLVRAPTRSHSRRFICRSRAPKAVRILKHSHNGTEPKTINARASPKKAALKCL